MQTEKEIKADLLAALNAVGDERLALLGFKRREASFTYTRILHDAEQDIVFAADCLPKYQPDEEVHLHPTMRLCMRPVSKVALKLVAGKKSLLADAPEIIVSQPIEFAAPKEQHIRWFASGNDQMKARIREIVAFIERWLAPFLDELRTPHDLIRIYERGDERMLKQRHWYLFVAAAQIVSRGNRADALSVLENNLGAPGLRKRYAVVFDTLTQGHPLWSAAGISDSEAS
ncbi:hypothetical protein GHK39_19455 [Sinorhizobium medicae]|uniref:hypothetical protein n=1 Tax=Sinorhizobium medicae TaxID=110321 RepID=UPI00129760E9|nr:hypothetical protein [Sinorhizobium medicae]MDX0414953.1 hypothetical protein [Sinorhizobium medicae]MDX0469884.1 hypothetical protein [Sinorhizobium medicae]MDX0476047.1 hypothetical protein [Sinorhizobium medicae]MDX0901176.1 hypothetical protein [Sinorhizobium medicae]MDX1176889.1 hypothetical protein [Sinorhizobium medicae]